MLRLTRPLVVAAAVALIAVGCSSNELDGDAAPTTTTTASATTSTTTTSVPGATTTTTTPPPPQIGHVFVINLENEGYDSTFGPGSQIPYLSQDLAAKGEILTHYYATSHHSLGNYIAQISGQPSNPATDADCPTFVPFVVDSTGANGVVTGQGCVYPPSVKTIGDQLEAERLTWRAYGEDMANSAPTEASSCRHPQIGGPDTTAEARPNDQYAARHMPFVYFHSIIDAGSCSSRVVDMRALDGDLESVDATSSLSYITPNLCHDGHDSPCVDREPGGMVSANLWLQTEVPKILNSPAFRKDGLLIVTFDEAENGDTTGCCGTEPGGGLVGAVVVGTGIAPGTTVDTPYNHYSLLCSIENAFGLDHLAKAADPGLACFIPPSGGGIAGKV